MSRQTKLLTERHWIMNLEDTIGCQPDIPVCAVCGKNVQHDRGFARANHQGIMVNLCCPLCIETFMKNPASYMARLFKNELLYDLKPAVKKQRCGPAQPT